MKFEKLRGTPGESDEIRGSLGNYKEGGGTLGKIWGNLMI